MFLRLESVTLLCIFTIISAINLALSTILSNKDGCVSSSSGLHNIYPIYARFRPAKAPLYNSKLLILMFLKQIGLNLKVLSSSLISSIMSIYSIKASDLFEKGAFTYLSQESQNKSKEQTAKLSGMHKP